MRFGLRLKRWVGATLVGVMLLTPVSPLMVVKPLAPVTAAKASPESDNLKKCLGGFSAAVDAATNIAEALGDPEYTACAAEAAAGNVITIAFMAAMTAAWALSSDVSFNNPKECKEGLANTVLSLVAKALNGVIGDGTGLIGGFLSSILPSSVLNSIQLIAVALGGDDYMNQFSDVAVQAAKDTVNDMLQALASALGPLLHYLDCGCEAAGTAAILKNAAAGVGVAAEACGSLFASLIDDPKAFIGALIDDPGAVINAVLGAVCDGIAKTGLDVCGAAKEVYDNLKKGCEELGVCNVAAAVYDGVKCFFTDCSQPYNAGPSPPGPCPIDVPLEITTLSPSCICSPPYGKSDFQVQHCYGPGYPCDPAPGYVCWACPAGSGRNADGYCAKCPLGIEPGPDGSCSKPYTCPAGQHYTQDNDGTCFSCPSGMTFSDDGQHCRMDCSDKPWTHFEASDFSYAGSGQLDVLKAAGLGSSYLQPGSCRCPANQYDNGSACVDVPVCDPTKNETYAPDINKCVPLCGTNSIYILGGDFPCKECTGTSVAYHNECVASCGSDQVRIGGQCTSCPDGTVIGGGKNAQGDNNTCVPGCAAGSVYAPWLLLLGLTQDKPMQIVVLPSGGSSDQPANSTAAPSGGAKSGGNSSGGSKTSGPQKTPGGADASSPLGGTQSATGGGGGGGGGNLCAPCGQNMRTITSTIAVTGEYSITVSQCTECPSGQISRSGDASCHIPTIFELFASRTTPPDFKVTPPVLAPGVKLKGDQQSPPKDLDKTRRGDGGTVNCPPGRIPNRSGTGCIIDLGDDFGSPGGSSRGGNSAGGRGPATGPSIAPPTRSGR